ncbi:hypothetical protein NHG24_03240 [Aerococcaceae bacterium NML210727]|nr:hypothetical protein [Aerococcaceae bacterium NML210727]MCW6654672.1 hypothetical protein [Aerococcaceae bacterium NML201296]MCW6674604.1 hypothetical protein [Aerococcaceae bacterium NML171108]
MSRRNQQIDIDHFINRRLTRSGWFFLVIVMSLLFLSLYFLVPNLRKSSVSSSSQAALEERVQMLEDKVEHLESILSSSSPN